MSIPPIVFYWENFGPMHIDRCEALARSLAGSRVVGLELWPRSGTYEWTNERTTSFEKVTVFPRAVETSPLRRFRRLYAACRTIGRGTYFLCGYQEIETWMLAATLRLTGSRVFVMGVSKFDDYKRHLWREVGKSFFLKPYQGGLSSDLRATDYLRFLGVPASRIAGGYNSLSIWRIRSAAGKPPAPDGTPFEERGFVVVARLVPKKNLGMLLDAYCIYRGHDPSPRTLTICGAGPLHGELAGQAQRLGLEEFVNFAGFVQSEDVSRILADGLCLLLPSIEEQFGNAVIEAQAMGLPVILSDNCGARDQLVRSGVNGFVVEPDNPEGMAWFMLQLARDEALWRHMSTKARASAELGDVTHFVAGVKKLLGGREA